MGELVGLVERVRLEKPRVLVVGDLMLDNYVFGRIKRMCPEAPIPIVDWIRATCSIGGAGSAAGNLKELGADVTLFGVVGDDRAGEVVRTICRDWKIALVTPPAPGARTTVKRRTYAEGELHYREDIETPLGPDAHLCLVESLRSNVQFDFDAILVSDYAKGVVDPNLLMVLKDTGLPVYADPKRPLSFYHGARAVFPNRLEADKSCRDDFGGPQSLEWLASAYLGGSALSSAMFEILAVTQGADGALVAWVEDGQVKSQTIQAAEVEDNDVCGAGDTFAAAFVRADLAGLSPLEAARFANIAAGTSTEMVGALAPPWEAILRNAVREDERCKS